MADPIIPPPDTAGYWHFTYITTDTLDGRWYGGKRSTKKHPLSDRYLGSGNWIRRHPARGRLVRREVAFLTTSKEAFEAEQEMITWALVLDDPFCMNECEGGLGATSETARRRATDPQWCKRNAAQNLRLASDPNWIESIARRTSDPVWRKNNAAGALKRAADPVWIKKHNAAAARLAANPNWREKVAETNRRLANNPRWLEKISATAANPEWQKNVAMAARRRATDPVWLENVRASAKKRSSNPEWREKHLMHLAKMRATKALLRAKSTSPE